MHLVESYGRICFDTGINEKSNTPIGKRTFMNIYLEGSGPPLKSTHNLLRTKPPDKKRCNLQGLEDECAGSYACVLGTSET